MLTYKIDVLETLKESGYNTTRLRKEKLLGENAIQSLRRGEMVGIIALEKIMLFNGLFITIIFPFSLFILIFAPIYFVETIFAFILFQWLCMVITEVLYLFKNYKI